MKYEWADRQRTVLQLIGVMGLMTVGVLEMNGCKKEVAEVKAGSGREIFEMRCAVCHGAEGEGKVGFYPAMAGSAWVSGAPEKMAAIILTGMKGPDGAYNGVMPGWGGVMGDAEIAEVITWLRAREGNPAFSAVEVKRVRLATSERGTFWTVQDLQSLDVR